MHKFNQKYTPSHVETFFVSRGKRVKDFAMRAGLLLRYEKLPSVHMV
jgi:hypothetical protein